MTIVSPGRKLAGRDRPLRAIPGAAASPDVTFQWKEHNMYGSYRPRRRWLRWFLVWAGGTLAVAVIGLVIEAAVSPGTGQPHNPGSGFLVSPATSTSSGSVPGTAGGSPALSCLLQVVQGRELVNGVYLGFTHSTAGAVSAADYVVGEVFSTLDPDRAAAVMRLTAAPSYASAPQQAAQGATDDREDLGLAASGPVPAGYSLLVQPEEYQTRKVRAGSVTVLLLCDFTTTQPGTGTQTQIAVFPVGMVWAQADWEVASFDAGGNASLAAEPFSSQAASLGWRELLPEESDSVS
jgi:hypothetical protein